MNGPVILLMNILLFAFVSRSKGPPNYSVPNKYLEKMIRPVSVIDSKVGITMEFWASKSQMFLKELYSRNLTLPTINKSIKVVER